MAPGRRVERVNLVVVEAAAAQLPGDRPAGGGLTPWSGRREAVHASYDRSVVVQRAPWTSKRLRLQAWLMSGSTVHPHVVRFTPVALSALLVLAACGSSSSGAAESLTDCNPLLGEARTAELTMVGAVGKGLNNLWVVDRDPHTGEPRMFVSEDASDSFNRVSTPYDVLTRVAVSRVVDTGTPDNGDERIDFTIGGPPSQSLLIERKAGKVSALRLSGGNPDSDSGALAILDEHAVETLPVYDFSTPVALETVAITDDGGHTLVVLRPQDKWSYSDFRVFYGPQPEMLERRVVSVARSNDGTTDIVFWVDGGTYHAHLPPSPPAPTSGDYPLIRGTLDTGHGALALTLALTLEEPAGERLPAAGFACFHHNVSKLDLVP